MTFSKYSPCHSYTQIFFISIISSISFSVSLREVNNELNNRTDVFEQPDYHLPSYMENNSEKQCGVNLIKFPRLPKKLNKSCKLTENEIEEIIEMKKSGATYKEIGNKYNITSQAAYYWCLTPEKRKIKIKMANESAVLRGYERPKKFDYVEYRERKLKLQPEYKKYENQFTSVVKRKIRPTFAKTRKKADKKYYKEHLEERKKYNKDYQLKNLDKFRVYNKKHRELYPEKVREQQRQSYYRNKNNPSLLK